MVKAILSLSSRFYQLVFIVHDGTGNVKFNLPKEAQSRGEKEKSGKDSGSSLNAGSSVGQKKDSGTNSRVP